jgi:integrase/recombinase XerD
MLTLYRRHTKSCEVHNTKLAPRAMRHYTACDCPIWIYGNTDKEHYPRQTTGLTDWKAAEAFRDSLTAKNKSAAVYGPRIDECGERFLEARAHELADITSKAYRLMFDRLTAYCASRGVHHMSELTVDLLEDFKSKGLPTITDTTKATIVQKLRCFLREAFRREWMPSALADRVRPHRAVREQKKPYTDAEVNCILAGASALESASVYAKHPATFRLLLELMLETGMRVSDAVRYIPTRAVRGKSFWIYSFEQKKNRRTKQPVTIEAFIPEQLKLAIDKCEWFSAKLPFWFGRDEYRAPHDVYDLMQVIGKKCGIADCRPHRLRDTRAVRWLLAGVPITEVARLLGHSSVTTTEKYYAAWIPARTDRLEGLLAQSLVKS